jgi:CheY-like chemotaxis protein
LQVKKKVLVVDDDDEFRDSVSVLLKARGYHVVMAESGEAGFEKAKKENPDLILLDVMMTHNTEGFDIARQLHDDARTKDIPVVTVTGISKATHVGFKYEPDETWLPVKEVLEKPVKPDVLLKAVETHIKK